MIPDFSSGFSIPSPSQIIRGGLHVGSSLVGRAATHIQPAGLWLAESILRSQVIPSVNLTGVTQRELNTTAPSTYYTPSILDPMEGEFAEFNIGPTHPIYTLKFTDQHRSICNRLRHQPLEENLKATLTELATVATPIKSSLPPLTAHDQQFLNDIRFQSPPPLSDAIKETLMQLANLSVNDPQMFERLKIRLNLTTEQVSAIKAVQAKIAMAKLNTIMNASRFYRISLLTLEERQALNTVNLRVTEEHLKNIGDLFNNPTSTIGAYANEVNYDYRSALIAEVLSKSLAYNDCLDGQQIDIPVRMANNQMILVTYAISKGSLGDNLPYYVFKPVEREGASPTHASREEVQRFARAWIDIRGTEPLIWKTDKQARYEAFAADIIDPQGVTSLPVWQRFNELDTLIKELSQYDPVTGAVGKPIQVTGHSLGGTLAQSVGSIFNPFIDQTFAFNSPGVDSHTLRCYQNLSLERQNKLVVFHRRGDPLSSIGAYRVGRHFECHLTPEARESERFNTSDAGLRHADVMLNASRTEHRVDSQRDERNLMRRGAEWLRNNAFSPALHLFQSATGRTPTWYARRAELHSFADRFIENQRACSPI